MSAFPRRGEVYFIDLSPSRGSEQGGMRPALVVSNNRSNQFSTVVTVVPITHTQPSRYFPQNVLIPAGILDMQPSTIYCGQIRTITRSRIKNYVAVLDETILTAVRIALRIHLDI